MNKKRSIYLDEITVIDHAYIDNAGCILGRSFNLSVVISGIIPDNTIDPEQVVIDFSKCKKLIKTYVDDNQFGFDHKLWVLPEQVTKIVNDTVCIVTPATILEMPLNAIKIIDSGFSYFEYLRLSIELELQRIYPNIQIEVQIDINKDRVGDCCDSDHYYFNYVHGLKSSSSFGCINISHGHSSYIDFKLKQDEDFEYSELKISTNNIYIYDANVVENNNISITIEYTSPIRGHFKATYNKEMYFRQNINIEVLKTETTIEFLIDHIEAKFGDNIHKLEWLKVSEGTSKGAVKYYQ